MGFFTAGTKDTTKAGTSYVEQVSTDEQEEPQLDTVTGFASWSTKAPSKAGVEHVETPDSGEQQETPFTAYLKAATKGKSGEAHTETPDAGEQQESPLGDCGAYIGLFFNAGPSGEITLDAGEQRENVLAVDAFFREGQETTTEPSAESTAEESPVAEVAPTDDRNAKLFKLCVRVDINYQNVSDVLAAASTEHQVFAYADDTVVTVNRTEGTVTLAYADVEDLAYSVNERLEKGDGNLVNLANVITQVVNSLDAYGTVKF